MITLPDSGTAKALAKHLRRSLAEQGTDLSHSAVLELIAQMYGVADWNTFSALAPSQPQRQSVVPIVRIFDWPAARDFYLGYLGWQVDWEHRFEDDLPLYTQISGPHGERLHLSEHHGDGTPGTAVIIEVSDIESLHTSLIAKQYCYARPGLEQQDWGRTVSVFDPFGNRITFLEPGSRDR